MDAQSGSDLCCGPCAGSDMSMKSRFVYTFQQRVDLVDALLRLSISSPTLPCRPHSPPSFGIGG